MAYLKPLHRTCQNGGCSSSATFGLYNRLNALVGEYCARHGKQRLVTMERSEMPKAPAALADAAGPGKG